MSRVLITGVAGLLGSHFSRHLLDSGHTVIGVDDMSGGYADFVDPRVRMHAVDIVDPAELNGVFQHESPEFVYHFAAYAAVGVSPFIRNFNYTVNTIGSANVVNAAVNYGVKKVVFSSSMDVYGSVHAPPYTEVMTPLPEDPYGIAKYGVELDLRAAKDMFDLDYSIVRPHNVFGIYQNIWDKYRNVLGIWIRQTLSGGNITVFGDGSQVRAFSDVKYYMSPFERLMSVGSGQTYNVGADQHTTILNAARKVQRIANLHGFSPEIVHLEPRAEVKLAYSDHTKARKDLAFEDNTDFNELVDGMFRWAMTQPQRPVKMMPYEIEKSLYSFWK